MVFSLFPAAALAADGAEAPAVNPATGRETGPAGDQRVALMVYGKSVTDASNVVWHAALNADVNETAAKYGDCFTLTNGTDYLDGSGGKVSVYTSEQYEDRGFAYNDGQLQHVGGRNVYTVYYSNSAFTSTYNETTEKVYLFRQGAGRLESDTVANF